MVDLDHISLSYAMDCDTWITWILMDVPFSSSISLWNFYISYRFGGSRRQIPTDQVFAYLIYIWKISYFAPGRPNDEEKPKTVVPTWAQKAFPKKVEWPKLVTYVTQEVTQMTVEYSIKSP